MKDGVLQIHFGSALQLAGRLFVMQSVAPVLQGSVVSYIIVHRHGMEYSVSLVWIAIAKMGINVHEGMVGAVWADTRAARMVVVKRIDSCIVVPSFLLFTSRCGGCAR